MRLAVPSFQNRVSPVFDTCQQVLVFEADGDGRMKAVPVDLSRVGSLKRAERLRELDVDVLLCGGITQDQAQRIQAAGIRIVPWLAGDVAEIVEAFRSGQLEQPRFAMRGCRRRCRRRGGQGRSDRMPRRGFRNPAS